MWRKKDEFDYGRIDNAANVEINHRPALYEALKEPLEESVLQYQVRSIKFTFYSYPCYYPRSGLLNEPEPLRVG